MIYLYAYTNHKEDLDSLRRVKAIYDSLQKEGIEAEVLVNEYRAQLLAREWGLPLATTIETIKDIDAVANINDIIVIDSPEALEGKVLNYPEHFKGVIYINSSCADVDFNGARVVELFKNEQILCSEIESYPKEDRAIFIYGDSDFDKNVLNNIESFKELNLDFYWGVYFFVKYEDIIKESFNSIIESEDYYEILQNYNIIVTSNVHIALEAAFNKKVVYFLSLKDTNNSLINIMQENGIDCIKEIDNINISAISKKYNIKLKNTNNLIVNIIKDYM